VHWEALPWSAGDLDPAVVGASLAARSDHPVSKAIAESLADERLDVEAFEALVGKGVQGSLQGQRFVLGYHRLIHDQGLCSAELEAKLAEHEALGRTITLLSAEDRVLALFAVADTLKD